MSISMRDLPSSSDEEVFGVDEQETFPPPLHSKSRINGEDFGKNTVDTSNAAFTLKPEQSKRKESNTLSILGQGSESFIKIISCRVSSTSSLENSPNNLFEGTTPKEIFLQSICSESDIKVQVENFDGKDIVSKKLGIKGHISSYLSKSKNYCNRGTVVSNSPDSINDTASLESSKTLNKSANIKIPPSVNMSLLSDEYQSMPSSSSSDTSCSSPKFQVKYEKTESFVKSFQKERKESKEQKSKFSVPRLTFSELLDSESSTTPCQRSVKTGDTLTESIKETLDMIQEDSANGEIKLLDDLTDQIVKEDLKFHLRPSDGTTITYFHLWICSIFTCSYLLYSFPRFFSGIVTGSVITYLAFCIIIWLLCPSAEIYDQYHSDLKQFLSKNRQPEMKVGLPKPEMLMKPKDLKAWIFVAKTFNTVFETELAQEIFVIVRKETLFLFLCKVINDPVYEIEKSTEKKKKGKLKGKNKKRARALAEKQVPLFSFECMYQVDLCTCILDLKPDDLPIRRIWSRKYPIKLTVPKNSLKKQKIDLTLEELTLGLDEIIDGKLSGGSNEVTLNNEEETFYLFSNTGREKETFFYRLQLCTIPLKHQVTFREIEGNKMSKQPSDSYPHYMAELITESEKVMQRTANGKKMEPYLAWLNVFLGRSFWDFRHNSIWTNKLHQKIQSRLSKINTPPFITDIKLTDLNCGHNIPIIHKGSIPVLDEYGVWTDLHISYKGYFTLTLETQLNIDYYIDLVSSIMKQKAGTDPKDHAQLSQITKMSGISNQDINEFDKESPEEHRPHTDEEGNQFVDDESVFHSEIQDVYSDAFEYVDNCDNETDPIMTDPRTKAFLESRAGKKVVSLVGWLAKSKIAKKVAGTEFAKKAYERAYKKFQKMSIVLKVEVQSVKGNLAVNIPPPPTNRLWFGFRGNPVIFITASPKVGDKQVRLTYLTSWIEKKLKEEFKKYLVMPNMQDLSIKLMDSHLLDIYPERPFS